MPILYTWDLYLPTVTLPTVQCTIVYIRVRTYYTYKRTIDVLLCYALSRYLCTMKIKNKKKQNRD